MLKSLGGGGDGHIYFSFCTRADLGKDRSRTRVSGLEDFLSGG